MTFPVIFRSRFYKILQTEQKSSPYSNISQNFLVPYKVLRGIRIDMLFLTVGVRAKRQREFLWGCIIIGAESTITKMYVCLSMYPITWVNGGRQVVWTETGKFEPNAGKSQVVVIGNVDLSMVPVVKMSGEELKFSKSVKNLGLATS